MQIFIKLLLLTLLAINTNLALAKNALTHKLNPPVFSQDSGFYPNEFDLILSHSETDATIYYTLDGSTPNPNNIDGKTYKYKNSYQLPSSSNKPINIKKDFLYNDYKTYKYSQPIAIKNRIYQPDIISQISTTNEVKAYYLPTAKKDENHWVNKFVKKTNMLITIINYKILKINRGINSGYRKAYQFFTKKKIPLGTHRFIADIPQITYAVYVKPKEYSFKGTPVRAIAVDSEGNQSQVINNTYFIGDKSQYKLPLLAITIPEKHLFDYKKGIFVAGKTYDDWIATGAEIPKSDKTPFNWIEIGKKKANINFDFGDKNNSVDVDIKPAGLGTRFKPNKSLKVYPNKKYSKHGIDFPIFESNENIDFARLMLRNNAHDGGSSLKDNIFQKVVSGLNFATQNDKVYFTFINGEPNGILTAKYRYDKHYIEQIYNLPNKNIDLIKMRWPLSRVDVLEGDNQAWTNLIQSLSRKADIETIKKQLDISSFIDYFVSEIYLDNDDWPHNNLRAWRYKNDDTNDGNNLLDGRWRWMMFDVDSIGARKNDIYLDRNRLKILLNGDNDVDPVFIFKSLMGYLEIRQEFIIRMADLINTTFDSQRVISFINNSYENVRHDMPKQIQRWQTPSDMKKWQYSIDQMIDFANKRPDIQRQQLQEQFELKDLYNLSVNVNDISAGTVVLNTLHLGSNDSNIKTPVAASVAATDMAKVLSFPWQGKYFKGMPLKISAIAKPGYEFVRWDITGIQLSESDLKNKNLTIVPSQNMQIKAVFDFEP